MFSRVQLCDPTDRGPPGSSVRGIHQAGVPERVVISSSEGSSRPGDGTGASCVSRIGRRILYRCATCVRPSSCSFCFHFLDVVIYSCARRLCGPFTSRGRSCCLVAVCGLLTAGSSLAAERELQDGGPAVAAPRLQCTGPVVVAHGVRCSTACALLNQGLNLCLLRQRAGSSSLSHQGSPRTYPC